MTTINRSVLEAMLARSRSIRVALDTRFATIPAYLKKLPWCVLEFGLAMAKPIPDLAVSDSAISGTLSFSGSPFLVRVPFSSILGVEEVGGAEEARPLEKPRRKLPAGWRVLPGGRADDGAQDDEETA